MSVTVVTESTTGPASYSTATGWVIATGLGTVQQGKVIVSVPGALPHCEFRYSRSGGDLTVHIFKHMYDKLTSIDAVSGLPSGVTAQGTSGQTYDADTTHIHSMAHNHGSQTSSTPVSGTAGTVTGALNNSYNLHSHVFDPPNYTGNTGVGDSHTHTWDNIYEHQHSVTNTETNATLTEITNGTDLSGVTFNWRAVG